MIDASKLNDIDSQVALLLKMAEDRVEDICESDTVVYASTNERQYA